MLTAVPMGVAMARLVPTATSDDPGQRADPQGHCHGDDHGGNHSRYAAVLHEEGEGGAQQADYRSDHGDRGVLTAEGSQHSVSQHLAAAGHIQSSAQSGDGADTHQNVPGQIGKGLLHGDGAGNKQEGGAQ